MCFYVLVITAAASRLKLMLSFAVGSLLGDVFCHLLPEVWSFIDRDDHKSHIKVGVWVIGGLLFFLIIEKLFGDETEFEVLQDTCDEINNQEHPDAEVMPKTLSSGLSETRKRKTIESDSINVFATQNGKSQRKHITNRNIPPSASDTNSSHIKVSGYLNLFANVVDNFTHGLAVAGSFLISYRVGILTTVAILLHEVPHEVGDFAILLRSGFDRWRAARAQFLTATGGVVGAMTALLSESAQSAEERTLWVLPFTSGGFLYIALVTVVPDLLAERHILESLKQIGCLLLGILSMVFVTLVFD
ncbi:hypothetical protein C0Q70_08905 [Pomacea canaliculata]|uniref:Zinc transporter ZIP13 n=1 Tax=Pomacea canaliculata TaxID=400727 RepID=A0A2T7P8A6_POMCA|nr:hypothetical protein C0Q70_08905 [Pomacea canaliculata]